MAAVFPNSVRQYTPQQDLVNTIIADNVNSLQEEVKKIEEVLGSAATSQNPLTSTWTGTFSQATTWGTVYDRLANIEAGLVSGVSNAPYTLTAGGSTITTTNNKGLTLRAGSTSLNLLETYSNANVLGFNLDASGLPKVATSNVIYVGSSDYTALTAATTAASTSAAGRIPLSTVTTLGDLILGTGNSTVTRLGIGSNGQSLIVSAGSVVWGVPTDTSKIPLATVTAVGDLILGSGAGAVSRLGIGASGTVLTSNGTTATWVAPVTSYVAQSNGTVTAASISSGVVRNVYTRTVAPTSSDGSVGDIWIVYA
jgi:sporulation protein YlmC with PRC-barrel domain